MDSTGLILVDIAFGDGQDTTIESNIVIDSVGLIQFTGSVFHTYQSPGLYTVQLHAFRPLNPNQYQYCNANIYTSQYLVADTCGNVEGSVYMDDNFNCVIDSGETTVPNTYVSISSNGQSYGADFADANGMYHFNMPVGQSYEVKFHTGGFTDVCPGNVIQIPTIPSIDNDFGIQCETDSFDLTGSLDGWGFRPGLVGFLNPVVWNNSCLGQSGTVKILLDPITTLVSQVPDSSVTWNGDTAIMDIESLIASYNWTTQGYILGLMVDSTAILDSLVCYEMWICPEIGDSDPSNNYIQACFPVVNSYDPNDKQVTPAGIGANGAILMNETMTYRLRFQNTGTAEAFNVHIMDTIDTDLDMTTFQVLAASHHMDVYFPDERIVKFDFPNINLPDSTSNEPASHGFVLYRIAQNPDLQPGTVIENTGHIYFDINPPVVTNTTVNTIDLFVDVQSNIDTDEIQFYPNPASQTITVITQEGVTTLSILEMSGREVLTQSLTSGRSEIDISRLSPGPYLLRSNGNGNVVISKLIKR